MHSETQMQPSEPYMSIPVSEFKALHGRIEELERERTALLAERELILADRSWEMSERIWARAYARQLYLEFQKLAGPDLDRYYVSGLLADAPEWVKGDDHTGELDDPIGEH